MISLRCEMADEPFSNPIAPPEFIRKEEATSQHQESHHPMTNEDFRKLMMTPRAPSSAWGTSVKSEAPSSVRGFRKPFTRKETNENKTKKKKFYASMKKQEDDILAELSKKYRDRAKERRDGDNPDYQAEDPANVIPAYGAVAPDIKSGFNAAERRKQIIEESKFLGGDMKHTHLVKGLDYALLQKVKAELSENAEDNVQEDEEPEDEDERKEVEEMEKEEEKPEKDPYAPKSIMGLNILNLIDRSKRAKRNDLFIPGRMAYMVDLEDECADDIPTTIIRSKTDCPNSDAVVSLSTNDIVINKLTQILSYLRQGGGKRKKNRDKSLFPPGDHSKEKDKKKLEKKKSTQEANSIYDDIGEYVPSLERKKRKDKDHR